MDTILGLLPFSDILDIGMGELMISLSMGCFIGIILAMTGIGGGVLIIPLLRIFFDMDPVLALGTASICASLMKINAAAMHIKMKNVDWKKSALMLAGAIPAIVITTALIVRLTNNPQTTELTNSAIETLLFAAIGFSLLVMIYKNKRQASAAVTKEIADEEVPAWQSVLAGAGCGAVVGSTGVLGVLLLPILTVFLKINIKKAIGSSIVVALVLSSISAITYSSGGQADLNTAILLMLGSFIGLPIAGFMMKLISEHLLSRMTLGLVSVSAVVTLSSVLA